MGVSRATLYRHLSDQEQRCLTARPSPGPGPAVGP
ncbi:hypothetical protein RB628_05760 [Streptomyces sp. ADMS]|nr:hypothetical protein [Streptomyces sp. ADMS]MDW4904864.1 hypothetical protein [Streptomyces sp. ADMS]